MDRNVARMKYPSFHFIVMEGKIQMNVKPLLFSLSLIALLLLTACEIESKEAKKSEESRKKFEEYVTEVTNQNPLNQYVDGVNVVFEEKKKYTTNVIGISYSFYYVLEINTNSSFASLNPLDKFEIMYHLKKEIGQQHEDKLFIDDEYDTIVRNTYFLSGSDKYTAYVHEMNSAEAYTYKGTGETHLKMLEVNGESNPVQAYTPSFFD